MASSLRRTLPLAVTSSRSISSIAGRESTCPKRGAGICSVTVVGAMRGLGGSLIDITTRSKASSASTP